MSDPKEEKRDVEELELDADTVKEHDDERPDGTRARRGPAGRARARFRSDPRSRRRRPRGRRGPRRPVHAFVRFGGAAVSDPKERRGEPEELDLDSETVRDLEPGKEEAD